MPSTDPQYLLTVADRQRLLTVNLARPVQRLRKDCGYAHTVHHLQGPADDLAAMSDIELVDFADRSAVNHFGGKAVRTSETTVSVKVLID